MIKTAQLHRMVMDKHICPYGIKSKWLLEREGFEVEDHHLVTRGQTDAFKEKHDVETTPQTFIDGERIGGYDALEVHFGKKKPKDQRNATSYQPLWQPARRFLLKRPNGLLRFLCADLPISSFAMSRAFRPCSLTMTYSPSAGCLTAIFIPLPRGLPGY